MKICYFFLISDEHHHNVLISNIGEGFSYSDASFNGTKKEQLRDWLQPKQNSTSSIFSHSHNDIFNDVFNDVFDDVLRIRRETRSDEDDDEKHERMSTHGKHGSISPTF